MEALGKDGLLVNVVRGGLMDELEPVRYLHEGVIGCTSLDLYENEPAVPPELLAMDNAVLSNHMAVIMPESIRGLVEDVITNLDAFFSGRPLDIGVSESDREELATTSFGELNGTHHEVEICQMLKLENL